MNWKKAFWISNIVYIVIIICILYFSIKQAFALYVSSVKTTYQQNEIKILANFSNGQKMTRNEVIKTIREGVMMKTFYPKSDTINTKNLLIIMDKDSIKSIQLKLKPNAQLSYL